MSDSHRNDDRLTVYALYHPEGAGYLHLQTLKNGTEGFTSLVWSYADRQLYVRKRTACQFAAWSVPSHDSRIAGQHVSSEVQAWRSYPSIPRLMDWTSYRHLPRSNHAHHKFVSTSTIWQYCRGGDMEDFIHRYLNHNRDRGFRNFPCRNHMPEAFIWKAMGQLVGAMNHLHQSRPGVGHADFFTENCFLDCPPNQVLPDCYVGDFGKSNLMYSYAWDAKGRVISTDEEANPQMADFRTVLGVIKSMMVLGIGLMRATPNGRHQDWSAVDAAFDTLERVSLGDPPRRADEDPLVFRDMDTFPRVGFPGDTEQLPDREPRRPSGPYRGLSDRPSPKYYTPLLFDTIRQFEKRIAIADNRVDDVNYFPEEKFNNRDWSYLAQAMESKAWDRMPQGRDKLYATYPVVDEVFEQVVQEVGQGWSEDTIRAKLLHTHEAVRAMHPHFEPVGPWKVAYVDRQTLTILGLSQKTFRTYNNPGMYSDMQRASLLRDEDSVRRDSDLSMTSDLVQHDDIMITSMLDNVAHE